MAGVYVVVVTNKNTNKSTDEIVNNLQSRMQQSYAYRSGRQAYEALKENANIVDNRYKFY